MQKMVFNLFVAGILFSSAALADSPSSSNESFYRTIVTQKITQCELKTQLASSRGENTRRCGLAAIGQVEFYRNHEEELVQMMQKNDVGTKPYKVHYYLIKAYNDVSGRRGNILAEK